MKCQKLAADGYISIMTQSGLFITQDRSQFCCIDYFMLKLPVTETLKYSHDLVITLFPLFM